MLERLVKFLLNTGEKMTHISCIIMVECFTHLLSDKDVDLSVNNVNLSDNNVDLSDLTVINFSNSDLFFFVRSP